MKKTLPIALGLLLLSSASLFAETRLSAVKTPGKTNITIEPFSGPNAQIAKVLTDTLVNDLNINGKFDAKTSGAASAVFKGSFTVSGNTVTATGECVHRGQTVVGETVTGSSDPAKARRIAHQFADAIVEKITGEPGIAMTKIAFISKKTGSKEVYLMDYDGSNALRLTSDRAIAGSPTLSSNARQIAYTSYKSGYPDVYVHDINSGQRKRVAGFGGLNSGAAFSPDGGELALTLSKDGNPELYTCSASGGGFNRLTDTPGAESGAGWSPDGSKIAYAFDGPGLPQIYVISSGGGSGRAITNTGYNTEPSWAPETGLIAFSRRAGNGFNIVVMNADGSESTTYTSGEHPSWAPNGRHLVYARGGTLHLLDVGSGRSIALRQDLGGCSEPAWSGKIR